MKYCPYCSAQNQDDSVFCSSCGKNMVQPLEPAAPPVYAPGQGQPYPPVNPQYAPPPVQPIPVKPGDPAKNWMAITAMILGILSVLTCCIWYVCLAFGIGGVVLGALGRGSQNRGMAVAGMVTGIIGVVFAVAALIFSIYALTEMPGWFEDFYSEYSDMFKLGPVFFRR